MVKDAQAHAGEDKRKREEIQARNETDQLIYQTEKNLKEFGEKMDPGAKGKLDAALERARQAIKGSDSAEIISARDGLNSAWHEVSSKMYAQGGPGAGQGPQGSQGGPEQPQGTEEPKQRQSGAKGGSAVDADFEVVD